MEAKTKDLFDFLDKQIKVKCNTFYFAGEPLFHNGDIIKEASQFYNYLQQNKDGFITVENLGDI